MKQLRLDLQNNFCKSVFSPKQPLTIRRIAPWWSGLKGSLLVYVGPSMLMDVTVAMKQRWKRRSGSGGWLSQSSLPLRKCFLRPWGPAGALTWLDPGPCGLDVEPGRQKIHWETAVYYDSFYRHSFCRLKNLTCVTFFFNFLTRNERACVQSTVDVLSKLRCLKPWSWRHSNSFPANHTSTSWFRKTLPSDPSNDPGFWAFTVILFFL